MRLERVLSTQFNPVIEHTHRLRKVKMASASSLFIIHNDRIVVEQYDGFHSHLPNSKPIEPNSQFNVASTRKSYTGFAVAWAVYSGFIHSIDDAVLTYLPELDKNVLEGITLRHFLTHTHGLRTNDDGKLYNHFRAGGGWDYRDENIVMLAEIVKRTTGKTVAQVCSEQIFQPMGFVETGWRTASNDNLVQVVVDPNQPPSPELRPSPDGDRPNLFASTRELAYWGYLNLKKGNIDGRQIIPEQIVQWTTSLQSPPLPDPDLPQNGFLWQVKDRPAKQSEIGPLVPAGSFQILGIMDQIILVIPKHNLVAVQFTNRLGNPPGFDYLAYTQAFGDCVTQCLID